MQSNTHQTYTDHRLSPRRASWVTAPLATTKCPALVQSVARARFRARARVPTNTASCELGAPAAPSLSSPGGGEGLGGNALLVVDKTGEARARGVALRVAERKKAWTAGNDSFTWRVPRVGEADTSVLRKFPGRG